MKTILVTGGAGYVGSAAVKALIQEGHEVIVVDNLSKGKKELVDSKATFYDTDLTSTKLEEVFKKHKIDTVMHFASYKAAGESMTEVVKYSDNITGTINLLNLMVKYDVKQLIYSSSAAVYGAPEYIPVDEKHPTKPINYYGFTKLECERIIEWYAKVYNVQYVFLRYFNVAGDAGLDYIDPEANNVFPIIMEVISGQREKFTVFGTDYETDDKTAVRDYIDINDLIRAHVLALKVKENEIINLGSSQGVSVKELVTFTKEVTGVDFPVEDGARREGDPPKLLASNTKAKEVLGWEPKVEIKEMIKTTFDAYKHQM